MLIKVHRNTVGLSQTEPGLCYIHLDGRLLVFFLLNDASARSDIYQSSQTVLLKRKFQRTVIEPQPLGFLGERTVYRAAGSEVK